MKLYVNRADEDWVVDRLRDEFIEHTHCDIVHSPRLADIIWLIAPWRWQELPIDIGSTPIVCSIHHITPWKFDKDDFKARDKLVTLYHSFSYKNVGFFSDHTDKEIVCIPYWSNSGKFGFRSVEKSYARAELDIPVGDFLIGSFQRDTEGTDLRSPKLEKGPDQFVAWVKKYREHVREMHVLLGGYRRQYMMQRLDEEQIKYTLIENANIGKIILMYSALDLYITASRVEGGPQAIIECALMGVPAVSTAVGIVDLVLPPSCVCSGKVYFPTEEDMKIARARALHYDIPNHVLLFENMFRTVLENQP